MSDVRRRTLFYLAGFDPRGPDHYHALYAKAVRRQARLTSATVSVGAAQRRAAARVAWPVAWRDADGAAVDTDYQFLDWHDLVMANWQTRRFAVMREVAEATARMLVGGALWKSFTWSRAGGLALAIPSLLLIVVPGLALLAAGLGLAADGPGARAGWWLVAALLAALALVGERRLQPAWLGRTMGFFNLYARGAAAGLGARVELFADAIAAAIDDPLVDEVLVVGHSYGTILAVEAVAAALARTASGRPVSLLTLGQIIATQGWIRGGDRLVTAVSAVAEDPRVHWVDFSSPSDGACGALVDSHTALTGRVAATGNPKLLNPKFYEIMSPALFNRRTRDFNAMHFQYILASRRPDLYDYVAMSAGPVTLADRWASHPSVRDFTRLRFGAARRVR